ncbi:microprocessor complex subunit partner of drosha isoform X1 [Osmia lignaria lignaria]|uniref:microprocessor complex subunit partner of drosha isoform X1 n=1 Tax=Osmia lignaria lignaria TaxID=1437193 RepID=UPI001478292C|nr:microprocessor complex subunit DGCR8 isoform X1 [Osmia lignaria]XP_034192403.1 microprocessor complex subunit DGCR8 isoform X1 [Osmia lignaria]XP_034192404.1 microprocessor complex subunit DGCR8 isoform X1 [Osmia lignaria]XP_034192405.1 microprocessor complex subunit DGCR8 isoform X1 [Osmia lignaria]XP_034192406.1 microprocessor complex subunit DGCR8 isoform X1 [Osmia lignaria]XP_034192408.1 microprocessor complex subunit DGCR8 isoform X1 [Osmia lignaria]XP_034192409.1 microprocessor compl
MDKEVPEEMPESSMMSQVTTVLNDQQSILEVNIDNHSKTSNKSHCSDMTEEDIVSADDTNIYNGSTTEDCITESNADSIAATDDLRQFDVLDDLERHPDQNCSDMDSDTNESMDSDVPDEEIEAMLEEGLPEEFKGKRKDKKDSVPYEEKEKLVLDEIGHNHFDVLPEGWVQVTHNSGMPLYLHKQSRVCTLAKPYFLGPGSVRKHEVPVSAIPCLQYKRALHEEEEERKKQKERDPNAEVCSLPSAKIETIQENRAAHSLDSEQLRNYCQSLFRFKAIKVMRFQSWSARRKFTKNKKHRKQLERPTLPDGTKLITFPVSSSNLAGSSGSATGDDNSGQRPPKHWIMNPSGKSYVCILHEYVQHALKKQPTYKFKELENAATPYSAVVCINDMEYGSGFGSSKKQAKANAARKTLEILIPQMRDKISGDNGGDTASGNNSRMIKASRANSDADLSFFDEISITDPRVAEFCAKTTEPSPHAILITCLQRNYGLGDMHINYSVNTLKHQRNEFTMRVGKHEATVVCRNKKDGKQRAAQAILQLMHPHIQSWGSLLRLYGSRSVKSFKEKKQLEQEITLLQGKAAVNQPNHAILSKLRQEMRKLAEQRQAIQPIGKFVPPDLPTGSAANLNNVDL